MEPAQTFYNQSATHFTLPLFVRGDTEVEGRLIADLAELFLSTLLFPGTRVTALHTKRPGIGAKLNMGAFTGNRWKAAQRKILSNEYAVVSIEAETPIFRIRRSGSPRTSTRSAATSLWVRARGR